MPFRYPLATVLRYRASLELREYLALEKLQQELTLVELKIRQLENDFTVAGKNRTTELAQGTSAVSVQAAYDYEKALEQYREVLRSRWQERKSAWRQQLASYERARRNRETLEKLRDQQLEAYNREQAKRSQAAIDDLFLARRRGSD